MEEELLPPRHVKRGTVYTKTKGLAEIFQICNVERTF